MSGFSEPKKMTQSSRRTMYYIPPEEFLSSNRSLVEHARFKLLYNELAPLYDLATSRHSEREAAFIHSVTQLFMPKATRVLDVGCGVGRHAELLHKKYGYSVTGIDICQKMVQLARQRCPDCEFLKMDMRDIELGDDFDIAICMWTTFNYLSKPEDTTRFFYGIHKSLCGSGLLVIDMKNYQRQITSRYFRETKNRSYLVKVSVRKKVIKNLNDAVYLYLIRNLKTGEESFALDQELNKVYTLEDVLTMAGSLFNPVKVYGDYNCDAEFIPNISERIILVLKKCQRQTNR